MAIRQRDVIDRLKAGETLLCTLPKGDTDSDAAVHYLSGGERVTKATYRKLQSQMEAVSPGLFPGAEPQEWRWAGE